MTLSARGIPTWRTLVGVTQIEAEGVECVWAKDHTAVWIDAPESAVGRREGRMVGIKLDPPLDPTAFANVAAIIADHPDVPVSHSHCGGLWTSIQVSCG